MEFFNLNFCLKIENIFMCNVFQLTINFFIMFSIPPAYSAHFSQWSQYKKLHFNDGLCINKIAMNEKILHHKYFIAVYNSRIKLSFFAAFRKIVFISPFARVHCLSIGLTHSLSLKMSGQHESNRCEFIRPYWPFFL